MTDVAANPADPLVDVRVEPERIPTLKAFANNLPEIALSERQMCDLELIATGAFSPLTGFMVNADYESVLNRMRLQDGAFWPMPICLDVSDLQARRLEAGQSAALRDPEGFLLAVLHIEDIWEVEREKEARQVFGALDEGHPGVRHLFHATGDHYVGGRLEVIHLPPHYDFQQLRHSPAEIRALCRKLGWERMVGFQTRNPIHRPQFEMTRRAMRDAEANLLILPTAGITHPGDFDHYTRIRCYREVMKKYPPDTHLLNLLPLAGRMAGPRDALLHAIIAKNYGCTHFIVGPHHANPGLTAEGEPFYAPEESQETAKAAAEEIGIEILAYPEMVYLPFEDEFRFADAVPPGSQAISFSGFDVRNRIRTGRRIPDWATFPEVVAELQRSYPPPRRQGLTVFFTGLSGAGKSTLARILYSRFLEMGDRPVTLLDGDIVRRNLSRELNFSREHRDVNVRRIGFVASEITKNRGIAICAPIAPYAATRSEIRSTIEAYGGFVEVHISTPLEVCEQRDRKGMYAKARAGLIKGFTGVDDPYETPMNPEVRIDTSTMTPNESVKNVLFFLSEKDYI